MDLSSVKRGIILLLLFSLVNTASIQVPHSTGNNHNNEDPGDNVRDDRQLVGVASIDRSVPLFLEKVRTLGTVSLETEKVPALVIKLPYRTIRLVLPKEANTERDLMFYIEGDRGDVIRVTIIHNPFTHLYHGSFYTYKSKVNFVYDPNPESNPIILAIVKNLFEE